MLTPATGWHLRVRLCTRNDMNGNLALMLPARGVYATGRGWPDAVIALGMAALALSGAMQIIRQAIGELGRFDPVVTPISARACGRHA